MGDRYTITERLDRGGMAEVFRGVAESIQGFKKAVAIKRILPSLTKNQKFVSMFLDEAKLSLYLQHANVVQVFDIGMADNTYFLVMEYVNGCNLKHLIQTTFQRNLRFDIGHAVYIMIEACKGLHYAHHLESPETNEPLHIVHRDISPPNILLSRMGEVKLVDFGLAKANSQIEKTDQGVVKGKFSYLSPEAARGVPVDPRADIFAIGIILWEMLAAKRLFYGDTDYQTVEQVRQARVPSLSALNPQVEPELDAIVRKALARDPADRYDSAASLGDALSQFLFSRRMKVTALDISKLVRAIQEERTRNKPKSSSLINALIQDEMGKLTSLLEGSSEEDSRAEGSQSLDPSSFVDTSSWTTDFGFDEPSSDNPPPAMESKTTAPPPPPRGSSGVGSLQQMLEPETGIHNIGKKKWAFVSLGFVLLTATVVIAYVYKEPVYQWLFGS